MHEALSILASHGYWIVFLWVFLDQAGLPVPAFPVLLAGGALARDGRLNLLAVIGSAALAAMLIDTIWFEIGRNRGKSVLSFICRTSLEPESCVDRTQSMFSRRGTWTLVISKFVPGMNVIASPMAGMTGISRWRFQVLNLIGASVFAMALVIPGYLFSQQLEHLLTVISTSGRVVFSLLAVLFVAYIGIKYIRRARFVRQLRVARISPDELMGQLEASAEVVVLDLRLPSHFDQSPETLPTAIRMAPNEVSRRHSEIPRDRDIVLYCSCPNENASTRAALLLKRYGIHRVRPLAGGYETWRQRDFPLASQYPFPRRQTV